MFDQLKNWYQQTLVLDEGQRLLFYQVLNAQLNAGMTLQKAFESLQGDDPVTPGIAKVAGAAALAGREGRLFADGLADTGCIPAPELGVLRVAEIAGTLSNACHNLKERAQDKLSFIGSVLVPNAYYATIAAVLFFMVWQARDLLDTIAIQASVTLLPVYKLSVFLHSWLPTLAILAGVMIFTIWYGRAHWAGPHRRLLLFFDTEYRSTLAIRVSDMAAAMAGQGANHIDILDAVEDAFGAERYVLWAVSTARERHVGAGESIETAFTDTLLPRSLTSLLAAMTPGGEQALYQTAYESLSQIQRARVQTQHKKLLIGLRALLLITIAILIIALITGIYTALSQN